MIDAYLSVLPSGLEYHFVDDWDVYHMGLGEVHCGTNAVRSLDAGWWETALDAVEGAL